MNKVFLGQQPALSGTFDHAQEHLLRSIYADELEEFDTEAISNQALNFYQRLGRMILDRKGDKTTGRS
jgi:hypothetical protein